MSVWPNNSSKYSICCEKGSRPKREIDVTVEISSVCHPQAFDCSIGKDEHLAVAFFQRGITFFKREKYV